MFGVPKCPVLAGAEALETKGRLSDAVPALCQRDIGLAKGGGLDSVRLLPCREVVEAICDPSVGGERVDDLVKVCLECAVWGVRCAATSTV